MFNALNLPGNPEFLKKQLEGYKNRERNLPTESDYQEEKTRLREFKPIRIDTFNHPTKEVMVEVPEYIERRSFSERLREALAYPVLWCSKFNRS